MFKFLCRHDWTGWGAWENEGCTRISRRSCKKCGKVEETSYSLHDFSPWDTDVQIIYKWSAIKTETVIVQVRACKTCGLVESRHEKAVTKS